MKKMFIVMMLLGFVAVSLAEISADYAPGTPDIFFEPKLDQGTASDVGWFTKAVHPTTRAHCMVSPVINGKYYLFGGPTTSGGAYTNDCYEYNISTDAWTLKTPMPTARGIGRAVLVRGKIYVIGGCITFGTSLGVVEIYDPVTDAWTTGPTMSVPKHDFGAGVYKDTWIYSVGGGNWSTGMPPTTSVQVLNTVTNTWSTATSMPTAMGAPGCGVIGNKIIMASGYVSAAGNNMVQVGTISPTDPTSITWTTGTVMPGGAVYRANSGVCNNMLYVCGGNLASGISNAANKYDPATNTWTALPNKPTAVSNVYGWAATTTGQLYFPVGYPGTTPYLNIHQMLDDASYTTDVGVDAIHSPTAVHSPNTAMIPKARVKNYGTAAQPTFSVVCSIMSGTTMRYTDTKTAPAMAVGDTALITFASWTPTISEGLTVIVRTLLGGDLNPGNDRMSKTTLIANFLVYEGFNDATFPPTGWQAVIGSGTYNWQRFTAGTNPTCTPYEGAGMAGYLSYSATSGQWARLISAPFTLAAATPCSLKFYMTLSSGFASAHDSIYVETSTNGTAFTTIAGFDRVSTAFAWIERAVYLGLLPVGNNYIAFRALSKYGDNMYMDWVRVTGTPSGVEENPNVNINLSTLNVVKPNPVRGIANISFNIAKSSATNLKIYDASGKLVKTLVNSSLESGTYNLTWNGTDDNNRAVSEGIYFYTLESDNHSSTKKLVLTR